MRGRTEVPDNVDKDKIEKYIFEAQEQYIKPILCTALFDRLINGVAGDRTLTALEKSLIEEVKPALIFRSYEKYLPFSDLQPSKSGFHKVVGENIEPLATSEKSIIIKEARRNANHYEAQLREFLDTNFETDTDWQDCKNKRVSGMGQWQMSTISKKRKRISVSRDYYDS